MRRFVILHLLLLICLAGCARRENEPIRLNYSLFFPPTHLQAVEAKEWAKEIEARSGGRVEIRIFAGGILSGASQCYSGVTEGISDIGMSCFSYTRGRFPLLEGLDLPVGYRDGRSATRIANRMLEKFRHSTEEIADTHVLYLHAHGPGFFASTSPIRNLADISGKNIRATGLSAKLVEALGGNAIGMSQSETYEALQKGVAQATLCPIETLKGWKQGEVINYVVGSDAIGYTSAMFVTMNLERWQSLPDDIKQIFTEVSAEWIDRHGTAWNSADEEGWTEVKSLGKKVSKISDEQSALWRERISPILDAYVAQAEGRGLPGRHFLEELLSEIAKADAPSTEGL